MSGTLSEKEKDIWTRAIHNVLGPIVPLFNDDSVSEIMINGPSAVYVERKGRIEKTDIEFRSEYDLEAGMRRVAQFAGRRLGPDDISVDARLPDGSRVQIVRSPAARNGMSVAIRKFSKTTLKIENIIGSSLTQEMADFLENSVASHKNVIISGGTGTGKTTMLNVLADYIDPAERILTIEDTAELQLNNEHVVTLESQKARDSGKGGITIRELFKASLRMRPDRIIVGECRGGEAVELLQAMTSGHDGTLATVHASTVHDTLNRLETMALMSDIDMPLNALRRQIASAVDIIVNIVRESSGLRKVARIATVEDNLDSKGDYVFETLFEF
jgi:pilus assembly protein CpaF